MSTAVVAHELVDRDRPADRADGHQHAPDVFGDSGHVANSGGQQPFHEPLRLWSSWIARRARRRADDGVAVEQYDPEPLTIDPTGAWEDLRVEAEP